MSCRSGASNVRPQRASYVLTRDTYLLPENHLAGTRPSSKFRHRLTQRETATHDELALIREVAVADADEGVVVLALAERRGMDVRPEEADRRQDALVEGSLSRRCS